eukprot:1214071-Prymnesium_polylepis.1
MGFEGQDTCAYDWSALGSFAKPRTMSLPVTLATAQSSAKATSESQPPCEMAYGLESSPRPTYTLRVLYTLLAMLVPLLAAGCGSWRSSSSA